MKIASFPALLAAALGAACFAPTASRAQETPPPAKTTTDTTNAAQTKPDASPKTFPLADILRDMVYAERGARAKKYAGSGGDGFELVAESSVAQILIPGISEVPTISNIEAELDTLIKALPPGTRWVKLMLPPPAKNKPFKGDDLADFALAQARLFGSVGEAVLPQGSVEVLSQSVPADKAAQIVPALNLKPVYLIVNPRAHAARTRGMADFAALSPDEQKAWAKNMAPVFLGMLPKDRMDVLQSMGRQFSALLEAAMSGMSESQMKQFFAEMGGETTEHGATIKFGETGGGTGK